MQSSVVKYYMHSILVVWLKSFIWGVLCQEALKETETGYSFCLTNIVTVVPVTGNSFCSKTAEISVIP